MSAGEMSMNDDVLLEIRNLTVEFEMFEGTIRAVDNISLAVKKNSVLGIIGESGSGKSVTAQSILRIVPSPPGRIRSGRILFRDGISGSSREIVDILTLNPGGRELRAIRGNKISMIFQEPMTSFGPLDTIGRQITEVVLTHEPEATYDQALARTIELLSAVGIPKADKIVHDYPHQLSGGMRQRAMIAMGLVCRPSLLLADEPTTALDVTVQAQILALLARLRSEYDMSMIYITHNLAVVSEIADEIAVMYLGNLCEKADAKTIAREPLHPYTHALWKSIPAMAGDIVRLEPIAGSVPSMADIPTGCVFSTRCSRMMKGICDGAHRPESVEVKPNHWVSCFLYSDATPSSRGE